MERLLDGPPPAMAGISLAATVVLGLAFAFGQLPLPLWVAFCLGIVAGASLTSMALTYLLIWAQTLDDGADAHRFRRQRRAID